MITVNKFRTPLLFVSVTIIVLVLGVAFREKKKHIVVEIDQPQNILNDANIKINKVVFSTTNKDNFKEWDLEAESAKYFEGEKRVALEKIKVNLYQQDGKIYHLIAETGELDTETRNINMRGQVEGVLPDQTRIETDTIKYTHKKRVITTNDKIVIIQGKFSMEGVGVVIDLDEERMSLLENVRAVGER